jgi:fibronectin type 3 domain-containing protein
MYRILIGIVLIMVGHTARTQQDYSGVFNSPVMPGPNGVYVYVVDSAKALRKTPRERIYILYKEEKKDAGFKKLLELTFPSSAAELDKRLGASLSQEIIQTRKIRTTADLYNLLAKGRFDTLGLYLTNTDVQQALGVLYIDKKVTGPTPGVSYRLATAYNGNERVLYQHALSDIRYVPLSRFKTYSYTISDSIAMVTWYSAGNRATYATLFGNIGSGTDNKLNPIGREYVFKRRDTMFVAYSVKTKPGSKLVLYIRAEDNPGNRGLASDTVHLLALGFANSISVRNLNAVDTLGSVLLTWDSLPAKAWCSGIQVLKSRFATSDFVVIDTLPITATTYRDRQTISGNVYYYQLRPMLFELPQKGKTVPVIVSVLTKKTTNKIMAPQGLQLSINDDKNIRLSWQPNFELDIFAYYVLRGTSAANMRVISPAVKDTVFVDTLQTLNAGITYLYAIAAMNMDMRWSDTSAPVAMQSMRATLLTAPGGLQARASATGIRLSWNDVSIQDASVTGYMIYRRRKGDPYFTPLNKTPWRGSSYTDTTLSAPGTYEYGCSSVDAWSHVSMLSPVAAVDSRGGPGAAPLYPPADFMLRNLSAGIEISLPPTAGERTTGAGTSRYIVYRRLLTEKTFKKIGELTESSLVYTDKQVLKDQLYAYTVTQQWEQTESSRSREKSIRRK